MERVGSYQMEQDLEKLFCLPKVQDLAVCEQAEAQVLRLVIETSKYRIEIEIG